MRTLNVLREGCWRPRAAVRRLSTALNGGLCAVAALSAQEPVAKSCLRIAFGPWVPSLDWSGAGHGDSAARLGEQVRRARDSVFGGQASAGGREEMQWTESGGVRQLLLSPEWWPAGVTITFDRAQNATRRGAAADTMLGEAVALVADGAQRPPRATARVVRTCPGSSP